MKTAVKLSSNFFSFFYKTTLQSCQRKLKSFSLWQLLSLSEPSLSTLSMIPAIRVTLRGLVASRELVTNARLFMGFGFMLVGLGSSLLYLSFDSNLIDQKWYYINWYYFLYTIKEELMLGFWAVGTFLFIPSKYKLGFIPCTLLLSYSVATIMHYSFFVNSNETFHAGIPLSIIVSAVSLSLGVIISMDYLTYRYHHLSRGNHSRFVGVAEMNLSPDQKEELYKALAKEYRNHNGRI
jgi:hypothetical protein